MVTVVVDKCLLVSVVRCELTIGRIMYLCFSITDIKVEP